MPTGDHYEPTGQFFSSCELAIRDEFAKVALPAAMAAHFHAAEKAGLPSPEMDLIADDAYRMAEAMMRRRSDQ